MNKPLDLPDVRLEREALLLAITHKKSGMKTLITPERLNAWLLRQLRQELISTKAGDDR